MTPARAPLLLFLLAAACGTSAGQSDATAPRNGDAAPPDTEAVVDAAAPSVDAAPPSDVRVLGGDDRDAIVVPDALAGDAPVSMSTPDGPQAIVDLGLPPPFDGPAPRSRPLDLLFVVDNSPSMQEEQQNLRTNFAALMQTLQALPGGLPDLHVGVVTSDLGAGDQKLPNGGCPTLGGDRGILQTKPECGLDANARFLSSFDNGTRNNFQGDLTKTFSCMANVGTRGCGYEHQLQAARVGLYESITIENAGFLRPDALLGIVIVTDEDDCSAPVRTDFFANDAPFHGTTGSFRCAQAGHLCNGIAPPIAPFDVPFELCQANEGGSLIKVSEIVASIRALKPVPDQQIVVAGIFGWPASGTGAHYRYVQNQREGGLIDYDAICNSGNGNATGALRLKRFIDSFGASGSFFSICEDDFSPALQTIAQRLAGRL
jgi:hypothetical protein